MKQCKNCNEYYLLGQERIFEKIKEIMGNKYSGSWLEKMEKEFL